MIAIRYDESQIDRSEELGLKEVVVRETYENPGLRCFKISAIQLVENHFGERFGFDSYNDVEKKSNGKGIVWNGEYLEGIKVRVFQWNGALKNVYIRYVGCDPDADLKEIREVLGEAGLKKKLQND